MSSWGEPYDVESDWSWPVFLTMCGICVLLVIVGLLSAQPPVTP